MAKAIQRCDKMYSMVLFVKLGGRDFLVMQPRAHVWQADVQSQDYYFCIIPGCSTLLQNASFMPPCCTSKDICLQHLTWLHSLKWLRSCLCFWHTHRSVWAVHTCFYTLQGIKCTFKSLLAVRQAHGFAFGKSDLFMLCALHVDSENQALVPQVGNHVGKCYVLFLVLLSGSCLLLELRRAALSFLIGSNRTLDISLHDLANSSSSCLETGKRQPSGEGECLCSFEFCSFCAICFQQDTILLQYGHTQSSSFLFLFSMKNVFFQI